MARIIRAANAIGAVSVSDLYAGTKGKWLSSGAASVSGETLRRWRELSAYHLPSKRRSRHNPAVGESPYDQLPDAPLPAEKPLRITEMMDKGYDYPDVHESVEPERYIVHIKHRRRRGEPHLDG